MAEEDYREAKRRLESIGSAQYRIDDSLKDLEYYFNPVESVGVGTTAGPGIGTTVSHDCYVENNCIISGNSYIARNVKLRKNVFIGTSCFIKENIELKENVNVMAGGIVINNISL